MSRPKGSTNKITKDVKERLRDFIDDVVNSIDVEFNGYYAKTEVITVIPTLRYT